MSLPSNLPHPPVAQAGHPPQWGQWAEYREEDGGLYPAIITFVGDRSPDGRYYNVAAMKLYPNKMVEGHFKPGGFDFHGWLYEVSTGQILYTPCAPPWP